MTLLGTAIAPRLKRVLVGCLLVSLLSVVVSGGAANTAPSRLPALARTVEHIDALPDDVQYLKLCDPSIKVISSAARFKQLEELFIVYNSRPVNANKISAPLSKLSKLGGLIRVELSGCFLNEDTLGAIGGFSSLEVLVIRDCAVDVKEGKPCLALLKTCTKLHTLRIQRAEVDIDSGAYDDFSSLPALRTLELIDMDLGADHMRAISRCTQLESLVARFGPGFGLNEIEDVESLGNLKNLAALQFSLLTDAKQRPQLHAALGEALGKLKKLRTLSISYQGEADGVLNRLYSLPDLRELEVAGDMTLCAILGGLKNLERLTLFGLRGSASLRGYQLEWLKKLKQLRALTLHGYEFDKLASYIEGHTELHELTINGVHKPGDLAGLSKITTLEKLELTLNAYRENKHTDTDEAGIAGVIAANPGLRSLTLTFPTYGTELSSAIGDLKSLETLSLTSGIYFPVPTTPVPPVSMFENLKSLRSLELYRLSSITPDVLAPLAELPNLQELTLGWCPGLSSVALFEKLGECARLTKLDIFAPDSSYESFQEGGASAAIGALQPLDNLKYLRVMGYELTDEAMQPLGSLKELRFLYLDRCRGISGAGLKYLFPLKNLHEFGCSEDLRRSKEFSEFRKLVPFS